MQNNVKQIIDLHIHSKYSRACSKKLEIPNIAKACEEKGIDIVSTGDFTHPLWFKHIQENLVEIGKTGLYKLKDGSSKTRFILGTEISCIYKHNNKVRRIHLCVFAPNFNAVESFTNKLLERGVNLSSDGRPIMGVSGKEIVEICSEVDDRMVVIPAHAWTPWFAVFGSKSGYDSLEECFGELTPKIFAIETGLSSDPFMNRQISKLDKITLVSNSDAHSLEKLGREANVLGFADESEISYSEIWNIIRSGDKEKFLYTIEFYPEEGMYHYDGHKSCGISMTPKDTKRAKGICPKCKKKLTVGVLYRVSELADREEKEIPTGFVPHKYIIPLREIIADCFGVGVQSKKVENEYRELLKLGSEFDVLLNIEIQVIKDKSSDKNIGIGVENMRFGKVKIEPGYDGVYGKINAFPSGKVRQKQVQLFLD